MATINIEKGTRTSLGDPLDNFGCKISPNTFRELNKDSLNLCEWRFAKLANGKFHKSTYVNWIDDSTSVNPSKDPSKEKKDDSEDSTDGANPSDECIVIPAKPQTMSVEFWLTIRNGSESKLHFGQIKTHYDLSRQLKGQELEDIGRFELSGGDENTQSIHVVTFHRNGASWDVERVEENHPFDQKGLLPYRQLYMSDAELDELQLKHRV
ncbi:hypothetical protein F4604DRAFT_1918591 [Suillus subluteus]|nr:hypothetical protein F4604DRAFT_1918591 [Suillus subluteus]